MNSNKISLESIEKDIERVGIVGLGYVGLNLALFLCEKGLNVIGIDIDDRLVEKIRSGVSSIKEIGLPQKLKKFVNQKK